MISGAQTRNRTKDTGIFSPLLYQLSYTPTRLAKGLLTDSHDMAEKMGFEPMRPLRTLTI